MPGRAFVPEGLERSGGSDGGTGLHLVAGPRSLCVHSLEEMVEPAAVPPQRAASDESVIVDYRQKAPSPPVREDQVTGRMHLVKAPELYRKAKALKAEKRYLEAVALLEEAKALLDTEAIAETP